MTEEKVVVLVEQPQPLSLRVLARQKTDHPDVPVYEMRRKWRW